MTKHEKAMNTSMGTLQRMRPPREAYAIAAAVSLRRLGSRTGDGAPSGTGAMEAPSAGTVLPDAADRGDDCGTGSLLSDLSSADDATRRSQKKSRGSMGYIFVCKKGGDQHE